MEPITVKYQHRHKAGHAHNDTWNTTDYYCPFCGKQTVWCEDSGGGDYYYGETVFCESCHEVFAEPRTWDYDEHDKKQMIENLKGIQ